MVADLKMKDMTRSLVRVPGSGRGHGGAASAISCDLGRVSSLAASIPVNPCLPAILAGIKMVPVSSTNYLAKNKLAENVAAINIQGTFTNVSNRRPINSEATSTNVSNRRPINSEAEPEVKQGTKRARVSVASTTTNVSSSEPVGVSPGTQSSGELETQNPTTNRRIVTARRTQPRRILSREYSKSIEDLLEEQRNLREENRLLQQQHAYYSRIHLETERRLFHIVSG